MSSINPAAYAIDESVLQNKIVHLSATPGTTEWADICAELLARCDDNVEVNEECVKADFWGTDEGRDWRVIVSGPVSQVYANE